MVAPSFQTFEVMSEPFIKNGKEYIKVKNPKTGTVREVRNYTDREYAKAYGNKSKDKGVVQLTPEQRKFYRPAAVRSMEILSTSPLTIRGSVAAPKAMAAVLLWQAYGAYIQEQRTCGRAETPA